MVQQAKTEMNAPVREREMASYAQLVEILKDKVRIVANKEEELAISRMNKNEFIRDNIQQLFDRNLVTAVVNTRILFRERKGEE